MAGIKVDNCAYPKIMQNTICKNLQQGILVQDNSSAMIVGNNIHNNIKSNIAFGGKCSVDTHIIKNSIHSGRCEGIFMIDGGKAYITRNKIF